MCNLYSITTNQAAIIALFRVVNRYVGNLPPMPGVFPDYPAPVVRNAGADRELTMMRWGMPPPPKFGRAAGHQHPQHVVTALAGLAEAGEPLPGPGEQLLGVRAGAEPGDRQEGRGLVRAQRRPAAVRLRRASGPSSKATAAPSRSRSPALTTSTAS